MNYWLELGLQLGVVAMEEMMIVAVWTWALVLQCLVMEDL